LKELLVVFYPLIKKKIDLIVMGSHGTSGIEMVIGSNTEKNSTPLRNPVLVIKKTIKLHLQQFFLPLIFSEETKPFKKWSNFPKCLMPIC
jgi:hypothetical protein